MIGAAGILATFFVIELTTALMINSIALLADAGHMLTDVVAVFMGLVAVILAKRGSSSPDRTYGWHRAEVFTAVANAVLLVGVAVFILFEAIERLGSKPSVPGVPMIVVALAASPPTFWWRCCSARTPRRAWQSRAPTWRSSPTQSAASAS